jgi:hypothetical protein
VTVFRWRLESLRRAGAGGDALADVAPPTRPLVGLRLAQVRRNIESARTAEELVAMAGSEPAPEETEWYRAVAAHGRDAAPALLAGLSALDPHDGCGRLRAQQLAGAFLWLDKAAVQSLLERFSQLTGVSKASSSVTLGLAHCTAAGDALWALFCDALAQGPRESLVAALWGLADLHDARASSAVAALLSSGVRFYEVLGFAAAAGDVAAVPPLLSRFDRAADQQEALDCLMALSAITLRLGCEVVERAMVRELGSGEQARARELVSLLTTDLGAKARDYYGAFGVLAEARLRGKHGSDRLLHQDLTLVL